MKKFLLSAVVFLVSSVSLAQMTFVSSETPVCLSQAESAVFAKAQRTSSDLKWTTFIGSNGSAEGFDVYLNDQVCRAVMNIADCSQASPIQCAGSVDELDN